MLNAHGLRLLRVSSTNNTFGVAANQQLTNLKATILDLIFSNFLASERTKAMGSPFKSRSPECMKKVFHLMDNVENTINDPVGAEVLHQYMEFRNSGDKNLAHQYLDVYDKCTVLLQETTSALTQDELDELVDLGLPRNKELELINVLNKDRITVNQVLCGIQAMCDKEISGSSDFSNFQIAVNEKLKKFQCSP